MKYNNYNEYKKEYARRRADRVTIGDVVKACIFGAVFGVLLALQQVKMYGVNHIFYHMFFYNKNY